MKNLAADFTLAAFPYMLFVSLSAAYGALACGPLVALVSLRTTLGALTAVPLVRIRTSGGAVGAFLAIVRPVVIPSSPSADSTCLAISGPVMTLIARLVARLTLAALPQMSSECAFQIQHFRPSTLRSCRTASRLRKNPPGTRYG
jgi:hypothetical protein